MRFLKIYGGALLILITTIVLYVSFTSDDMDKGVYNWTLIGCGAAVLVGVLLMVFGGKSADKIGGK